MLHVFRYAVVGGTAAVFDIGLYWIGINFLGIHYFVASAISFIVATIVNYVVGIKILFVQEARFSKKNEIVLVFLVSAAGLVMHQIVLVFMIEVMGVGKLVSKLVSTATVFMWNYAARAFYVFSPES